LFETDPFAELGRRLSFRFGEHRRGEVDAEHLGLRVATGDRERTLAGAGAEVEHTRRRW
jgi:hypothetical protein